MKTAWDGLEARSFSRGDSGSPLARSLPSGDRALSRYFRGLERVANKLIDSLAPVTIVRPPQAGWVATAPRIYQQFWCVPLLRSGNSSIGAELNRFVVRPAAPLVARVAGLHSFLLDGLGIGHYSPAPLVRNLSVPSVLEN